MSVETRRDRDVDSRIPRPPRRLTCERPDRDEPRMTCGYPLPCPYHTVIVDLTSAPRLIKTTVPLRAAVSEATSGRIREIARALSAEPTETRRRIAATAMKASARTKKSAVDR